MYSQLELSGVKEFKNAKLVQRYLGHSDVAKALRYYVDVFPEDLEEAAEMLAKKSRVKIILTLC